MSRELVYGVMEVGRDLCYLGVLGTILLTWVRDNIWDEVITPI